jgi:hypothetical protein
MTVTNAATTVARSSEIDARDSKSGLGLDSIVLLKKQDKCSVKNILSCSGNSLPKLRAERQCSLIESTELGNLFLMEGPAANDIKRTFYVTGCKYLFIRRVF